MHNAKELRYQDVARRYLFVNGRLWRKWPNKSELVDFSRNNTGDGRCRLSLGVGRKELAHRMIFSLFHGVDLPAGLVIDHWDGNPLNNDISNLRLVTVAENNRNRKKHRSGIPVRFCYDKTNDSWRYIVNGRTILTRKDYHALEAAVKALEAGGGK